MSNTRDLVAEFQQALEGVVGLYHDARTGFTLGFERLVAAQKVVVAAHPSDPEANSVLALDRRRHTYGKGAPWSRSARVQHISTQGEFKERNRGGGINHRLIGNLCVVAIYQFWEDEYRTALAQSLELSDKMMLKVPVFGDLRHLRNSIIHHRGIALPEAERCEFLKWFREGDLIVIDDDMFDDMADAVRSALSDLVGA